MSKKRFSDEAYKHYRYTSADDITEEVLLDFINHHQTNQVPRLKELEEYYLGNNTEVLKDRRRHESEMEKADHRATHSFAAYISNFIKGYMMGIPLKTSYPDDDAIDEWLRDVNIANDADAHNSELALNQSIFGRAYELLYRTDETHFVEVDVKECFVIYDATVEMNPIAGVRYVQDVTDEDKYVVYFYTDKEVVVYSAESSFEQLAEIDRTNHVFGGVPLIEYENNKYRYGDFEKVLHLIDLYDNAQSDTANYMTDLNDAMLKIIGNVKMTMDDAKEYRKANIMLLEPSTDADGKEGKVDADYIYKKYDVEGTEAYKNRIRDDILMFTNTPNLLDEKFSGNSSGVAMMFKTFGLEQDRVSKERSFKRSLRNRYRLINNVSEVASEQTFDIAGIDITFTPNLPRDIKAEMDWFTRAGGELSNETMLNQLTFIENAHDEMEKLEEESPQAQARESMFQFPEDEEEESEQGAT